MTRTAAPLPSTRSWSAVQCRIAWRTEDVDGFLVRQAGPLLDRLRMAGHLADWYFQRTDDGLLFGLRGADWCTVKALRSDLARLIAQSRRPGNAALADVGETTHAPDPARFAADSAHFAADPERFATIDDAAGFAAPDLHPTRVALAAAEDVFCRATELALTTLAVPGARLTAATELVMATAHALRLDRPTTAAWLGGSTSAGAQPLDVRWSRLARTRDHALIRWTNAVRRARRGVEGHAEAPPTAEWLAVWRTQLDLLLNRLGLTPAETRSLYARTASSLAAADPFAADPLHLSLAG